MITIKRNKSKAQKDKIFWNQLMKSVLDNAKLQRARPSNALRRNYDVPAHHFLP